MTDIPARTLTHSPSAIRSQYNVLRALILRDIRTRFFGNGLGYLIAIAWPLVHILMLLTLYIMGGRSSPLGGSVVLFLALAVVPVINYTYMSRFVLMSVMMNKPLLGLPPVKLMDIILARAILEAAAAVITAFVVFTALYAIDIEIMPTDVPQLLYAYLANLFLALGVGCLVGVISLRLPGVIIAMILFNIILYVTSGVLFMPSAFPEPILDVISYNPILHSVEWVRESFYVNYKSPVLSKQYPIIFGGVSLVLALAVDRVFRKFLTAV